MADSCGSESTTAPEEGFPKNRRIRRGVDFKRAFDRRCSVADDLFIVYACENELPCSRIGLSVSRKVGGAPVRNRWKRLIREVFRRMSQEADYGVDFVVIPRTHRSKTTSPPSLKLTQQSLQSLLPRARRRLQKPQK